MPYYREKGPGVQGKRCQNTDTAFLALRLEVFLYLLKLWIGRGATDRRATLPKASSEILRSFQSKISDSGWTRQSWEVPTTVSLCTLPPIPPSSKSHGKPTSQKCRFKNINRSCVLEGVREIAQKHFFLGGGGEFHDNKIGKTICDNKISCQKKIVHGVLRGAARRKAQFPFIFALLQTLFSCSEMRLFSPLRLAPRWRQPPEAPLELHCHFGGSKPF